MVKNKCLYEGMGKIVGIKEGPRDKHRVLGGVADSPTAHLNLMQHCMLTTLNLEKVFP